eukprot:TRINITY_DN2648_c0_g1_i2.p1 TRINITY_DN2648_c0_g1~~TRINITY_DN2648_c0_g1_i2.p1  ORF type:complete len:139 (-),score=19.54 TRINITY_DN2648_c0_g1_i2:441-857(-)
MPVREIAPPCPPCIGARFNPPHCHAVRDSCPCETRRLFGVAVLCIARCQTGIGRCAEVAPLQMYAEIDAPQATPLQLSELQSRVNQECPMSQVAQKSGALESEVEYVPIRAETRREEKVAYAQRPDVPGGSHRPPPMR